MTQKEFIENEIAIITKAIAIEKIAKHQEEVLRKSLTVEEFDYLFDSDIRDLEDFVSTLDGMMSLRREQ